jgi:hypothetical protein
VKVGGGGRQGEAAPPRTRGGALQAADAALQLTVCVCWLDAVRAAVGVPVLPPGERPLAHGLEDPWTHPHGYKLSVELHTDEGALWARRQQELVWQAPSNQAVLNLEHLDSGACGAATTQPSLRCGRVAPTTRHAGLQWGQLLE